MHEKETFAVETHDLCWLSIIRCDFCLINSVKYFFDSLFRPLRNHARTRTYINNQLPGCNFGFVFLINVMSIYLLYTMQLKYINDFQNGKSIMAKNRFRPLGHNRHRLMTPIASIMFYKVFGGVDISKT